MRIASYNVENLFARPKALSHADWAIGRPILEAHERVNALMASEVYDEEIKRQISELLVRLDIYAINNQGAIRRHDSQDPRWAWLRKNRGSFDREPQDTTQDIEIIAEGRSSWIGWVELAEAEIDEVATRMTARVIADVNADVIGIVEAEDRPSLARFNASMLAGRYAQVMLIDGNDDRGIDVGIMSRAGYELRSIRSNVYLRDAQGEVFSRDCPQYEVRTAGGSTVHVLVNHFKSQSGGGGDKRRRQAFAARNIARALVEQGQHVVLVGDLNEGPATEGTPAENLAPLLGPESPLRACYGLQGFEVGPRLGTFDSCGLRNRLDYILISESLVPRFQGGAIFRRGLWGTRITRPDAWDTYPEMSDRTEQASDHAAVYVDLDL